MAQLRVLGPVELVVDGESPVAMAPRVRRLLAALVTRANAVTSADWLVEAVWAEHQPGSGDAALQTLVSRLRVGLKNADPALIAVLTRAPGYQLRLDRSALDAWRLEDLAGQAHRLLPDEPERAVSMLEEAAGLWAGPPFAEFADAEFARVEVARLAELRLGIEEDRAEAELQLGNHAAAAARLEGLVREHPLRERPAALLMLTRSRAGQQSAALEVFADHRRRLVEEMGLDPSARLTALHTAILNDDPTLQPDDPIRSSTAVRVPASPRTARISAPSLLGRDADVAELVSELQTERLVTLTGPGGVGKTSLALATAAACGDTQPDGVWWCGLGAVPGPVSVAPAVCTAVGVPGNAAQDPTQRVVGYLADRSMLLVIDNCEHVAEEISRLVRHLLRRCPGVRVLATSRLPMSLPEEVVFPVSPLSLPARGEEDSAELLGSPAVRLFLTRARQRVRGFDVGDGGLPEVAELCRRLDGLPLAIELAAAQMTSMTPGDLVERLHWRFKVLRAGPAADPRHRTLHAVVDWSYELLDDDARRNLEVLSVFAGAFSLRDAEELLLAVALGRGWEAADAVNPVGVLVDHSMIATSAPAGSFVLLETIRSYGRERLDERAWATDARRAHATLFAARSAATFPHLYGSQQLTDCHELVVSLAEIRTAHGWAVQHDLGLAAQLVGSQSILMEQLVLPEVAQWATALTGLLESRSVGSGAGEVTTDALARVYALAAASARFSGDLDAGSAWIQRASELATEPATICYVCTVQCELTFFGGALEISESFGNMILDVVGEHLELAGFGAIALVERALIRAYRGDPVSGAEIAAVAQQDAERHDWPVPAAWALYARGETVIDHDPAAADTLLTEALDRARDLDDRYLIGVALVSLASVRGRHGDPVAALSLFADVVRHWRDREDWTHQWTTIRNVVELFYRLRRFDAAAVVVAALRARGERATGFGSDAARMVEITDSLETQVPESRRTGLTAHGSSLTDHELVSFVLAELAAAQPS